MAMKQSRRKFKYVSGQSEKKAEENKKRSEKQKKSASEWRLKSSRREQVNRTQRETSDGNFDRKKTRTGKVEYVSKGIPGKVKADGRQGEKKRKSESQNALAEKV